MVRLFEMSKHAKSRVTCLDCHKAVGNQTEVEHRGFEISKSVTSLNCKQCHSTQYDQFVKSRHGAPAWAAVHGAKDFSPEQILFSEQYHKGAVKRPANQLALLEGPAATVKGCESCHAVGKPNKDGSIGNCTQCHSRHMASVELARTPQTCGQCHMGPDHSQIEIYNESKHGALFDMLRSRMNLAAPPQKLTTTDMPVPTCATCHMSGLEGQKVTHDVTDRLSYWLFAPISKKRPGYAKGQAEMKETCLKCHARKEVDQFYIEAEQVVVKTNKIVAEAQAIMDRLKRKGLLTAKPFDQPIDYLYFDLWHYYGRTAKHGAFMGGADFVQWHGNYELQHKMVKLKAIARKLEK